MKRRAFLEQALLVGAVAGLSTSTEGLGSELASQIPFLDAANRGPQRDPLAVQRGTLVVDARNTSDTLDTPKGLERLRAGGINCSVSDAGGIEGIGASYRFIDNHRDAIAVATTVREIRQLYREGKISRVFHFQGPAALQREQDWRSALRVYHEVGLRISAVALNVAGRFGGGCLTPDVALTREGRRLVEEIHKLRIVLDVGGHTGDRTSFDALEMSAGVPVVCSHTNARAIVDNPRNISDELAEAIAKTGGVIGVTAVNDFHVRSRKDVKIRRMPQVDLEKHLDQYDYLKKLVGADHIGLGADNIEGMMLESLSLYPEQYSDPEYFLYVKGFESISELPNVTAGLIHRGWSTGECRKVLGENWLRVYEKVWGA